MLCPLYRSTLYNIVRYFFRSREWRNGRHIDDLVLKYHHHDALVRPQRYEKTTKDCWWYQYGRDGLKSELSPLGGLKTTSLCLLSDAERDSWSHQTGEESTCLHATLWYINTSRSSLSSLMCRRRSAILAPDLPRPSTESRIDTHQQLTNLFNVGKSDEQ